MLRKNVYLLYPAGYSGSYINWAIQVSDCDLTDQTVRDPVNSTKSEKYGGAGTSHMHTRIPTHQGLFHHLIWVLYNRPTDKKVYVVNCGDSNINLAVAMIAQYDTDGVFVLVHDNADASIRSYGNINCVTKWPTYIEAALSLKVINPNLPPLHEGFDAYNCAKDRQFRNWLVENPQLFMHLSSPESQQFDDYIDSYADWYKVRNLRQPHEVNTDMYVDRVDLTNRLFSLTCTQVCAPEFVHWFKNFMSDSQVSTNYTCEHVSDFHDTYIAAQPNLQWFKSLEQWEQTGELDQYLTSHSVIEAEIVSRILALSNIKELDNSHRDHWVSAYTRLRGAEWPELDTDPYSFHTLPDWIQQEMTEFGFEPHVARPLDAVRQLDWRNMSTESINKVYQNSLSRT